MIVHSETYREYVLEIKFFPELLPSEDPFGQGLPEYFLAIVSGLKVPSGERLSRKGDAIVAGKQFVDRLLLHPVTGATFTKAQRDLMEEGL